MTFTEESKLDVDEITIQYSFYDGSAFLVKTLIRCEALEISFI